MKKLISMFMSITIVISSSLTTLAFNTINEEDRYKSVYEITHNELTTLALNYSDSFSEINNISIGDIIPMYNINDILVGFSISYMSDEIPYGYINVDFTQENPITEFCIFENTQSLYESLLPDDLAVFNRISDIEVEDKKIYSIGASQYAIPNNVENGTMFYLSHEKEVFLEQSELPYEYDIKPMNLSSEVSYDSYNDIFNSSTTIVNNATKMQKYSSSKSLISENSLVQNTKKYACAVAALTAIANQENILLSNNIYTTFNTLWELTNTSASSTQNTIYGTVIYGSTYDKFLATAMQEYAQTMKKSNTQTITNSSPAFSFYTGAVNSNISSTLSYRILLTDGSQSGHTINVVGYSNTNGNNYLIVADGWTTNAPKYVDFSNIDFADKYGVKYIIQ